MNKTRVFDLHCDTLDRLAWPTLPAALNLGEKAYPGASGQAAGRLEDFARAGGHLSLDRMAAFAWTQCLAVFVPDPLDPAQSADFFERVAASLPAHAAAHPDLLAVARDARSIQDVLGSGRTCGLLTIENGKLLAARGETDRAGRAMVAHLADEGVKMVTLTWNAPNPLGSGHDSEQPLTAFGRAMLAALEDARIVADVSHLNDPGFWDVARLARRPFAASHSNSRTVCDVPRNLTDDQFRAIRDAGGIVGLNFCRGFVAPSADPTPDELFAHVDHWLDLGGEKVVALGSDYDGCDVPSWLAPCDALATLADEARHRYGSDQANRLLFGNAHDFFVRNETL